jgi:hypothetical protein
MTQGVQCGGGEKKRRGKEERQVLDSPATEESEDNKRERVILNDHLIGSNHGMALKKIR